MKMARVGTRMTVDDNDHCVDSYIDDDDDDDDDVVVGCAVWS